jgi:hypothetical protein
MAQEADDPQQEAAEGLPTELDPRSARSRGRKFDPSLHFRKLGGRGEYLDVKWRLTWLRSEYPEALIETKCLHWQFNDKVKANNFALFWARVTLPDGAGCAEAHGSESQNDFGDFFEKAETKAVGRALEYLGYGTTSAKDDQEALADAPYSERDAPARDRRDSYRDRDQDRNRYQDDARARDRDRDRDDERGRDRGRARRDDDDDDDRERRPARRGREEPIPIAKGKKAAPPPDDDDDAIDDDVNRAFGFPAVEHEGAVYTNLLQVQQAMDAMPGADAMARHTGRQALYRAIVKARWTTAAVGEIKGYWTAANQRDTREDAAGQVPDDEDDE